MPYNHPHCHQLSALLSHLAHDVAAYRRALAPFGADVPALVRAALDMLERATRGLSDPNDKG